MMIHFLRRDVLDSTDRELIIAVFLSNFTNRPSGQGPAEAHLFFCRRKGCAYEVETRWGTVGSCS